ncbi:unnamed protein product [Linum trigynum]|uniref:non-specific serine/threonine protein kinase n=1 Tax=Linum trigynum TaxID=586398 RepID=A0AAV2CLW1_9ROSI
METFGCRANAITPFFLLLLLLQSILLSSTAQQLPPSETRVLYRIQKLLEYPEPLQSWNNWTNFCYLPASPALTVLCSSDGHLTDLTIRGNKTSPSRLPNPIPKNKTFFALSGKFSLDSLFTDLTKLPNLKTLSLVSLGLWGHLPSKINRFASLQVFNLSSNFITGEIPPSIGSLKTLTSLVLADNLINGTVPGDIKMLVSLQELNLGGNNLRSEFPSATILKALIHLQRLNLSRNKLMGPIPPALFSLPSIQSVDLSDNNLNGALSVNTSCGSQLRFVDLSSNLLVGNLPSCISASAIASWNCLSGGKPKQHPYSFCHKEALAVKPPTNKGKKQGSSSSSIRLGLILGIIGGAVGLSFLIGLVIFVMVRRSDAKELVPEHRFAPSLADKMSVRSSVHTFESRRVPKTMRSAAIGLPPYHIFSLEEIEDATNNFDPLNFIGESTQGQLYKGCLVDGSEVLVKSVKLKHKNLPQNLMQHIEVLSKLRHLHLVSVLGHCIVTFQDHPTSVATLFVIFEHITNGSLHDYLTDRRKKEVLKWPQRMAITMGVARGIHFLHTGVAPGIFGNDVKMENVLLDESLTAKLSNYTLPLPSKVGTESPLRGQDLPNLNSTENSDKEDVYQLGMIVLQLITGKRIKSSEEVEELKAQLEKGLAEGQSKLRDMADSTTKGTYAYESLRTAAEITINCLSKEPNSRPSIEDVLWNLQYSSQVQDGWNSSGNLNTSQM